MSTRSVRLHLDVDMDPAAAFEQIAAELGTALAERGLRLEPGPGGRILRGSAEVAGVVAWEPGHRLRLRWPPVPWTGGEPTELEVRSDPAGDGRACVTVVHAGWPDALGAGAEAVGWFATQVAAPALDAMTADRLGDWVTDRVARRPAGSAARATYRDPLYHLPNFRVILDELALSPGDHLLEVGCGGGALLKEALRTGCRADAIDHSPDMLAVARAENATAIAEGRLALRQADAHQLPFADGTFTCAVMTGVLGFLREPARVFAEIHRTLRPGGRLVALGSDPELRGTPAAPEPMASRLSFYDEAALAALARAGGFRSVRVERRSLYEQARAAGVPEADLPLFGTASRFLIAVRDEAGPLGGGAPGQPARCP